VAWGLPAERIAVIENIMDHDVLQSSHALAGRKSLRVEADRRLTLAYFGQINPYKGVDVLLEACASLPKRIRKRLEVRIHGENKHFRDTEFGRKVDRLMEETQDVVRMMGSYRNQEVVSLMRGSDWIVVPSIWWENSPIVIQEARMAGRPMIYADIGGMAEKVDPQVDLPFSAGSSGALADVIRYLMEGQLQVESEILSAHAQSRLALNVETYNRHKAFYMGQLSAAKERGQLAS
jgi:glycosyltransferase involved in cell wall biosynthesis